MLHLNNYGKLLQTFKSPQFGGCEWKIHRLCSEIQSVDVLVKMSFWEILCFVEPFGLGAETESHRSLSAAKRQLRKLWMFIIIIVVNNVCIFIKHLMAKSIIEISVLMSVWVQMCVCLEPFHRFRIWLMRTFCIGRADAWGVSSSANVSHKETQTQRERELTPTVILLLQHGLTESKRSG